MSTSAASAIVVERYDRHVLASGGIERVQQEDMCQALGRSPITKYQNEGGPGPEDVIRLLRDTIAPNLAIGSVRRFMDTPAFRWLIGGEYTISRVSRHHWVRFAEANDLGPAATVQRIDDLAARVADAFAEMVSRHHSQTNV